MHYGIIYIAGSVGHFAPAGTYNAPVTALQRILQWELYQPAGISLRLIFREYKVSGEGERMRSENQIASKRKVTSRILVIIQMYARARAFERGEQRGRD